MPETVQTETTENANELLDFQKDPTYTDIYFNHAQLGFTGFDIFAYLSDAHNAPLGSKITVRQKARIIMSPMEAVLFRNLLDSTLAMYEGKYGKINLPKGIVE